MLMTELEFKEAVKKYLVDNMIYDGNPVSASAIQDEINGAWDFAPQTIRGWLQQLTKDRTSNIHAVKRPGNNYGAKKWYYFTSEEKVKRSPPKEQKSIKEMTLEQIPHQEEMDDFQFLVAAIAAFNENVKDYYEEKKGNRNYKLIKENLEAIADMVDKCKCTLSTMLYENL